jgi:formate C-acetyltransferase
MENMSINSCIRLSKTVPSRIMTLRQDLLRSKPEISAERAKLVTLAYQETEGEPYVIRRAKALQKILKEIPISIYDQEIIVGGIAEKRRSAPVFPEMGVDWLEEELEETLETRPQDKFVVSTKCKDELKKIIPYWREKTIREKVFKTLPEDVINARRAKVFTLDNHEEGGLGHVLVDYPTIFSIGLDGIRKIVDKNIAESKRSDPEAIKRLQFWQAATIVLDSAIAFANRYAELARRLAETQPEIGRKKELEDIADVCSRVFKNKTQSFHDAIQALWFIHVIIQLETNGTAISPGRLDQHLYPYFKADVESNQLSLEEAQKLIDCFWLKMNELIKLRSKFGSSVHAGFPMNMNVTIGGVTPTGEDATNELSFLFLNAQEHIHLSQPQFSTRVHARSPEEFLLRASEVIKIGGGIPQLISDEVLVPALLNRGIPLELARDYAPIGCIEVGFIGLWGRGNGGYFNVPKALELALNRGIDRLTGKKLGIDTGAPEEFATFENVVDAFRSQLDYCIELLAIENNVIDMIHAEIMPHVFISTLVPGCIEKGRDVTEGGAKYNWTVPLIVGLVNTGNSLAAIKKEVYEDKKISMSDLIEALDKDFEGSDELHKILMQSVKYGNDNDYVDLIVRNISRMVVDACENHTTFRGGLMAPPAFFSLAVNLPFGWATAATPDGRKALEPLGDGISPCHGDDIHGPTAVLKSASKIDHLRSCGAILNQKLTPTVLRNKKDLMAFVNLFKTYLLDLGGSHVQFNVVSADELRDAQKYPENYKGLVIRVTGYSAFFTELSKDVQDDIIGRTEHQSIV